MSDQPKDPENLRSELEILLQDSAELLKRSEERRAESDRIASHAAEVRRISEEERETMLKRAKKTP